MVHYGFKEHADVPDIVQRLPAKGVPVNPALTSYFLSRAIVVPNEATARLFAPSMQVAAAAGPPSHARTAAHVSSGGAEGLV